MELIEAKRICRALWLGSDDRLPKMERYQQITDELNRRDPDGDYKRGSIARWLNERAPAEAPLIDVALPLPGTRDQFQILDETQRAALEFMHELAKKIPLWLATQDPTKWSTRDGLSAMRTLPACLEAMVRVQKEIEELRERYHKATDGEDQVMRDVTPIDPSFNESIGQLRANVAKLAPRG